MLSWSCAAQPGPCCEFYFFSAASSESWDDDGLIGSSGCSRPGAPAGGTARTESADCRWCAGSRCRRGPPSCSSGRCRFLRGGKVTLYLEAKRKLSWLLDECAQGVFFFIQRINSERIDLFSDQTQSKNVIIVEIVVVLLGLNCTKFVYWTDFNHRCARKTCSAKRLSAGS